MSENGKRNARRKMSAGIVMCVIACLCFGGGALALSRYGEEYQRVQDMRAVVEVEAFYPGVVVDQIDLGGKTMDEARVLFSDKEQALAEQYQMKLRHDTSTWNLTIPLTFNTDEVLGAAWQAGREGTLEERYAAVTALTDSPQSFTIEYTADTTKIANLASRIETELFIAKVDATVQGFDVEQKSFTFTEEISGQHVDAEALVARMNAAVEQQNFEWLDVPVVEDPAEVTQEALSKNYRLLSSFSTTATSSKPRNTNISLALASFNGTAVLPGETFSINNATGRRSAEKGYKQAGTIVNGNLVDEFGGGVCQVSSTLFNAVVRAGLTVTERHNHSWPSTYIDAGMDAAIDYGSLDLKFVNNSNGTIYLVSSFDWNRNKLTVEIYGMAIVPEGAKVTLKATRTSTIPEPASTYNQDASLAAGTVVETRKGRSGSTYNTKVIYSYADGTEEVAWEYKSSYRAIAAIYSVGTAPVNGGNGSDTDLYD